jgi:hypothetical protein
MQAFLRQEALVACSMLTSIVHMCGTMHVATHNRLAREVEGDEEDDDQVLYYTILYYSIKYFIILIVTPTLL